MQLFGLLLHSPFESCKKFWKNTVVEYSLLKLNQLLHRKKKGGIGRDLVSEICMVRVKQLQNGEITGRLDTGGS